MIKYLEVKAISFFLVKILDEKKIKEVAEKVGEQIDKIMDGRYGAKRSERLQARFIRVINEFANSLIVKLKEDWKEVDYGKEKK